MAPIEPIKRKTQDDQSAIASTSGAIQNPMQQNFNFFGNSSGLDAGSMNANGQKPSAAPASSGHGQGAGMVNITSNGTYGVGKSTGVSNQQDSPSATAYQRQGAGGSLFGAGFADSAGGGDAFIKRKQDEGGQFA